MCAASPVPSAPGGDLDASSIPREVDQLLTHVDWVVTCDASMRCIPNGAVAIDGNTLVAV